MNKTELSLLTVRGGGDSGMVSLAVFQVRTVLSTALRCYGYTGGVCTVVSNAKHS